MSGNINTNFSGNTVSSFFSRVRILHFAILAGLVMITGILFFLLRTGSGGQGLGKANQVLSILGPVIGLVTLLAAFLSYKVKMKSAVKQNSLADKLGIFMTAHIIKLALLEGGAIINLVLFYLTGNLQLLIYAGLAILVIAINFPGKYRVSNDLELDEEQRRLLEDPDHIL